jgi:hypothetical protein
MRVMPAMKSFACLILIISLLFNSGCSDSRYPDVPTSGGNGRIAVRGDIIDDSKAEWYRLGRAKLYLKVSSSANPDYYWLYPVNVQMPTSGQRAFSRLTPFLYEENSYGRLMIELLEDRSWSQDEEDLVVEASKLGGSLICDGISIYSISEGIPLNIKGETRERISKILGLTSKVIISNMNEHKFQSYGHYDYAVSPTSIDVNRTNYITICEDLTKKARINVYLYLVPKN